MPRRPQRQQRRLQVDGSAVGGPGGAQVECRDIACVPPDPDGFIEQGLEDGSGIAEILLLAGGVEGLQKRLRDPRLVGQVGGAVGHLVAALGGGADQAVAQPEVWIEVVSHLHGDDIGAGLDLGLVVFCVAGHHQRRAHRDRLHGSIHGGGIAEVQEHLGVGRVPRREQPIGDLLTEALGPLLPGDRGGAGTRGVGGAGAGGRYRRRLRHQQVGGALRSVELVCGRRRCRSQGLRLRRQGVARTAAWIRSQGLSRQQPEGVSGHSVLAVRTGDSCRGAWAPGGRQVAAGEMAGQARGHLGTEVAQGSKIQVRPGNSGGHRAGLVAEGAPSGRRLAAGQGQNGERKRTEAAHAWSIAGGLHAGRRTRRAAHIIRGVKVAIVGSRHFPELERVRDYVSSLPPGATVVTGGASGVDATAGEAARSRQLGLIKLPPRLEESSDPAASARRNQDLVDAAEVLVAFWDGRSAGTRKTVERALDSGREVHVFLPQNTGSKLQGHGGQGQLDEEAPG